MLVLFHLLKLIQEFGFRFIHISTHLELMTDHMVLVQTDTVLQVLTEEKWKTSTVLDIPAVANSSSSLLSSMLYNSIGSQIQFEENDKK